MALEISASTLGGSIGDGHSASMVDISHLPAPRRNHARVEEPQAGTPPTTVGVTSQSTEAAGNGFRTPRRALGPVKLRRRARGTALNAQAPRRLRKQPARQRPPQCSKSGSLPQGCTEDLTI